MEFHQRMFVVRFEYITKVNIGDEIFSQPCIIFDRKYQLNIKEIPKILYCKTTFFVRIFGHYYLRIQLDWNDYFCMNLSIGLKIIRVHQVIVFEMKTIFCAPNF